MIQSRERRVKIKLCIIACGFSKKGDIFCSPPYDIDSRELDEIPEPIVILPQQQIVTIQVYPETRMALRHTTIGSGSTSNLSSQASPK